MRALQYAEYGPPEVLRVVDVEEPHAGTGQIRIAVKAAGVNPVDWKLRQGLMKRSLPAIPGSDVAGVVEEPHAGTGQIRIAVKAAGVNPVDWKLRQGLMKRSLPAIPGSDVAGVVDE